MTGILCVTFDFKRLHYPIKNVACRLRAKYIYEKNAVSGQVDRFLAAKALSIIVRKAKNLKSLV